MIFQKHIPTFPLCKYVDSILYLEGNNKGVGFPKSAMSLVFNLNDSFKLYSDREFIDYTDYKKHWVSGLQTKPTYVESYGESKMVVVQFNTVGAFELLNTPIHYFTNNFVTLDNVFGNTADEVWEQLNEAKSFFEKIQVTESFLCKHLLQSTFKYENLLGAVENLLKRKEIVSITDICSQFQISRKHLNFLFKEFTGASPKMLSSLHRFQNVLKTLSSTPSEFLTGVAFEFEYFDQSHFNNDFKKFTNLTPSSYIKNGENIPSLKIIPHFMPFID